MNTSEIEYRPYRVLTYCYWVLAACGMFFFVIAGANLQGNLETAVLFMIIGVANIFCTKLCHDVAMVTIFFKTDEIWVINDGKTRCSVTPWESLPYGYYSKNTKGQWCLTLSKEPLDRRQVKEIVNQHPFKLTVCTDDALMIYIDSTQDTTAIKKLISEKVPSISTYKSGDITLGN